MNYLEQEFIRLSNDNEESNQQSEEFVSQAWDDGVIMSILESEGYNGQLKDIVLDLMKHNELIPYDGVLGGTMKFYDENSIQVLTDRWVFANFEDGHMHGYMLLRYNINEGKISWEVIDSYLVD